MLPLTAAEEKTAMVWAPGSLKNSPLPGLRSTVTQRREPSPVCDSSSTILAGTNTGGRSE